MNSVRGIVSYIFCAVTLYTRESSEKIMVLAASRTNFMRLSISGRLEWGEETSSERFFFEVDLGISM